LAAQLFDLAETTSPVQPQHPACRPEPFHMHFVIPADNKEVKQEDVMGRGLLLWLLGIPIPIIILIWVLGGLHG
jgi:hypothetical protein